MEPSGAHAIGRNSASSGYLELYVLFTAMYSLTGARMNGAQACCIEMDAEAVQYAEADEGAPASDEAAPMSRGLLGLGMQKTARYLEFFTIFRYGVSFIVLDLLSICAT